MGFDPVSYLMGASASNSSGGLRVQLYENVAVTFNKQTYVSIDISQIDRNLENAKAILPFCTSQGTVLLAAINTARTLIQIYSPAGAVTGGLSVNLIAYY